MVLKAISNTGPLLHLFEINLLKVLDIFSSLSIPQEVAKELQKNNVPLPKKIQILNLLSSSKNTVKVLTNQHNLDLGESCAIALTLQEKTSLFLTDDLDARSVARAYNLEVHGTLGIILRAFRQGIIDKSTAIEKCKALHTTSTLFITKDLIAQILRAIGEFSQ